MGNMTSFNATSKIDSDDKLDPAFFISEAAQNNTCSFNSVVIDRENVLLKCKIDIKT